MLLPKMKMKMNTSSRMESVQVKDIKSWIPNKKQYTTELVAKVFDGDILPNGKERQPEVRLPLHTGAVIRRQASKPGIFCAFQSVITRK